MINHFCLLIALIIRHINVIPSIFINCSENILMRFMRFMKNVKSKVPLPVRLCKFKLSGKCARINITQLLAIRTIVVETLLYY